MIGLTFSFLFYFRIFLVTTLHNLAGYYNCKKGNSSKETGTYKYAYLPIIYCTQLEFIFRKYVSLPFYLYNINIDILFSFYQGTY